MRHSVYMGILEKCKIINFLLYILIAYAFCCLSIHNCICARTAEKLCTSAELVRDLEVAKHFCVLHLTNDRPNCSGLLSLSTFSVSSWACCVTPIGMPNLSFRWKINGVTFLFNVYERFYFCHVLLTFFNVFLFFGERFFIYGHYSM